MKKILTVVLFLSLLVLIGAIGLTVVKQNQQKQEEARIEAEAEAQKQAEEEAQKEEEAKEQELEEAIEENTLDEDSYTYEETDEAFYAQSKAEVRDLPNDQAEVIGTLSLDQSVSAVAKCNETDYYKIKINGDYGYIASKDVSKDYIDIPLPISGDVVVPSATKDILFIGNSITMYPATDDWWGSGWGMGASTYLNDYTHLTISAKGYSSYDIMSMRAWEFSSTRNYELDDLDKYIKNYAYNTIVIELGENAKGHERHLEADFLDMIDYIRTYNPNARIVMLDNFWKFDKVISIKKSVASQAGITYVSLSDIQGNKDLQWQEGQTFTSIDGVEYTANSFLAGHPNDAGYEAIANHLISAL